MGQQTYKYRFRHLYVDRYGSILGRVSAEAGKSASDVFGTWSDWGDRWAADKEKRFAGEMPTHVRETWTDSVETVCEVVNLANLRRYANRGKDSREELLTNFIRFHEENGELGQGGEGRARRQYAMNIICGREMGRMYALNVSMQTVTREARRAACLEGYLDIDITNCFPNCITPLYTGRDLGAVRKYTSNTPLWRRAVAEYYDISIEESKEVLMCELYGFPYPQKLHIAIAAYSPLRRMAIRRRGRRAPGDMRGKPRRPGAFLSE